MTDSKKHPYANSVVAHLLPNMARGGPGPAFDWLRGQRNAAPPPVHMPDIFHGQSVLNTFAHPHGLNPGEMLGHLKEIWKEDGFLPPAETLIRFNERVTPGFEHDEKLKQAIRSNFQQDSFTGFYSKDAAAVAFGLGHLYCVVHGLPCTLVPKADIRNLKGLNQHTEKLYNTAGYNEPRTPADPLEWREPGWRTHVNDMMRIMLTRGVRRIEQVASSLAPHTGVIAGRDGGDEVTMLVMGIDKGTFDRGIKPELYKSDEETVTNFGLLNLPHPKYGGIISQGIGLATGSIDLTGAGRWNDKKDQAALEAKVDALTLGAIRHFSQSPQWRPQIFAEFKTRLAGVTKSKAEYHSACLMAEELANNMYVALLNSDGPTVDLRQTGKRNSMANRLERTLFHVSHELRTRHDEWGGRFRTALPVEATEAGYVLRSVTMPTARNLLAERERLYKGISEDAVFAQDYLRPIVPPTPPDPFIRRRTKLGPQIEPLFQPTWLERPPRITRYLRQNYPHLSAEKAQGLTASIASLPSIDPPTGLLMPSAFKAQIERWGHDTEILRRYATTQLAQGDKATDPLLVEVMKETGTKPADLRTFCLMVDSIGLTALNAECGNANADLWLGDSARRLREASHAQGFHITSGKGRGNAVATHAGAGRFMVALPPIIERDGKPHIVTKHDALAVGKAVADSMSELNGVPISAHMHALGGSSRSTLTYGELANPRAGSEKEVGVGAFYGATVIRLPVSGRNQGGQFFETLNKFQDHARSRRLDARYKNLPEMVKPSAALKKLSPSLPAPQLRTRLRPRKDGPIGFD